MAQMKGETNQFKNNKSTCTTDHDRVNGNGKKEKKTLSHMIRRLLGSVFSHRAPFSMRQARKTRLSRLVFLHAGFIEFGRAADVNAEIGNGKSDASKNDLALDSTWL